MKELTTDLRESVNSPPLNTISTELNISDNRNDNEYHRLLEHCNSNGIIEGKCSQIQQFEKERGRILQDIESEEREKQWFISCLDRINQQLMLLSQSNGYLSQSERVVWQQLQRDAGHLQETMQQKLGSKADIERRQEARVHSIFLIDKQMENLSQDEAQGNDHLKRDISRNINEAEGVFEKMTSGTQTGEMIMVKNHSKSAAPPPASVLVNGDYVNSVYNGSWLMDRVLWYSSPSSVGGSLHSFSHDEIGSYKSGTFNYRNRNQAQQQFGTKVEMVYSLLSMLRSQDKEDMSEKLLTMSASVDSCIAMRQSGCLPLLIELLHGIEENPTEFGHPSREIRRRAAQTLHNIIRSHPDDKRGRRETRVLKLLEQVRDYCNTIRDSDSGSDEDPTSLTVAKIVDRYPVSAVAMLMKLSFDEEHRHTMCQLGGLQALAELIQLDYETHGNVNAQESITMRRYAGMALTNLTFGDGTNKALLCSNRLLMRALVAQLHSPSEDLRQVAASVLRNLSWRADQASKKALREIGAVGVLVKASMEAIKESTLKSILSALWNLSAHCSMNKADICSVDGALAFLVTTLTYRSPSKTHAIVENGGGILRNISSHIAVREDYRAILRDHNCLVVLLQHLRSPSLTIVSNACGTLWNLSARCVEDQRTLWDLGAVSMLRNLVHSKHKMIAMGSSAALKNLVQARPGEMAVSSDKIVFGTVPSLLVRKQRALEEELDHNLSETCENLDSPKTSPTHHYSDRKLNRDNRAMKAIHKPSLSTGPYQLHGRMYHSVGGQLSPGKVSRSESKDSVLTTKSDSSHDRLKSLNMLLRHRQSHPVNESEETSVDQPLQVPQVVLESRIQYVMQEVTRQIAVESGELLDKRHDRSSRFLKNSNTYVNEQETQGDNKLLDKYSSITTMIEKLDLCDEGSEQPVNYSLQYTEETESCNKIQISDSGEKACRNDIYNDYAETDLDDPDQLTNYSLRYTEDTDTTDTFCPPGPKDEKPYFAGGDYQAKESSIHDDSVRIYCTEDTPLNFSTATSMTDLRDINRSTRHEKINAPVNVVIKDQQNDRTVSYCEEGTPVCFSRVSSLSSLNSSAEVGNTSSNLLPTSSDYHEKVIAEETPKTKSCIASKQHISIQDCKTVRFDEEQLVEETPLMFSRCSSLGSLSSFDQHSIQDDRSSVISDFSRRASEVVSPSDLPDSPGETRPSTPPPSSILDPSHLSAQHKVAKCDKDCGGNCDVFDDVARVYAVEGTPLQFSETTSLSSLHFSAPNDTKDTDKTADIAADDKVSDGEEDREGDDLLAACISSAMPNNTRHSAPKKTNIKLVSKVNILSKNDNAGSQRLRTSGIPIKCSNIRAPTQSSIHSPKLTCSYCPSVTDNNSSRDSNSDGGYFLDEESMLAQCIRSGMPTAVPPKVIAVADKMKQNYGRNLIEGSSNAHAFASLEILKCKTKFNSKIENESPPKTATRQLFEAVNQRSDSKNAKCESLDRDVELIACKIDEKIASKLNYNKSALKPLIENRFDQVATPSVNSPRKECEFDDGQEHHRQFQVEDTPVCFSANSSLSSLSVDSCGVESTASEQALLDDCINSGMPPHSLRASVSAKSLPESLDRKSVVKERNDNNESVNENTFPEDTEKDSCSRVNDEVGRLHVRSSIGDIGGGDVSLIDNIKPPSLMEDTTDMTSSSYSVASLVSETLESKSEVSLNSDLVMRILQPTVEMFNSARGSTNFTFYENLENINPPSTLMETTADTLYEVTEVGTETVANGNETDVEDDLPEDDRTFNGLKRTVVKLDSEEIYISPEDVQVLKENAELVVTTLNEIQFQNFSAEESLSEDMLLECETISLVSNESDSSFTNSESHSDNMGTCRGAKIVKPINKNTDSQLKEEDKPVGVRGRRRLTHARQQMLISSSRRFSSPKPKEMIVKPTKTSALRTTQSQQKVANNDGSKRGFNRIPSSGIPTQKHKLMSVSARGLVQKSCSETVMQPRPPIKQATFTKDNPSQHSVPKISPTKTKIPLYGQTSRLTQSPNLHREEKSYAYTTAKVAAESKFASQRVQSLSPVSRSLYPPRVLLTNKKLPVASTSTKEVSKCSNSEKIFEGNIRHSPIIQIQAKSLQLSSPIRSTSNVSLCSSTSSSTTSNSTKSGDRKETPRVNSRLNYVRKGKMTNIVANQPSVQLKRSSTFEKLNTKMSPLPAAELAASSTASVVTTENKGANVNSAIVSPFNYHGPKVKKKSRIPIQEGVNSEDIANDESKQQCLVTYV